MTGVPRRAPDAADTYNTVIFLHIGASGGSTLHPALERQYQAGASFTVDSAKPITAFAELPWSERERVRLLKGHVTFGIHAFVRPPATYFTLLRDPVERTISHYYFVRRSRLHRHHHRVVTEHFTLHDYVTSGVTVETDNWQVRALSGLVDRPFGAVDRHMFEQARDNAKTYFSVVGLTEHYDESLVLLRQTFGWRPLYYTRANTGVNRPRTGDVPHDVLESVRGQNRWDAELYRELQQDFHARTSTVEFQRDVARFRYKNKAYQRSHVLGRALSRAAKRHLPVRAATLRAS